MPYHIILITLLAALLHASWNALLRGGSDRLTSMTTMCVSVLVSCAMMALFFPVPAQASWLFLLASGILHTGYNLFLVRSYRAGEFGQVYPIARGSSPILITMGAALVAGEHITSAALFGIILISVGIISLAFKGRKIALPSLPYALGTGCFIAAYSVTDGMGARSAGNVLSYILWMCCVEGLFMALTYCLRRSPRELLRSFPGKGMAVIGGQLMLLAYGTVIYAMSQAPMGMVSALRETSVLFALLIGHFFFKEHLSLKRVASGGIIVAGILLIG